MAATKPLFFFLSTLFLFSTASSSSSNDFDIYMVLLHWNPATCSDKDIAHPCYKVPSNKFSISGLLPTRVSPFQVVGPCKGTSFNPNAMSSILFSLRQKWPDIISGNDEELWKKEWESYGTCSEDYLHQVEYFSLAINSATSHNLLVILENNGMRPIDEVYFRRDVVGVVQRAIGVTPAVRCNVNGLSGTQQLHEIGLCYTKDREEPVSCPEEATTCGEILEWFPYMRRLYGYFQVLFHWQPATCMNGSPFHHPNCFHNPELRFSINGVWPTRRNRHVLQSCTNTTFDINQISSIQARLDRAWPDLNNRRNDGLWRREWTKYGTCSEDQFGQLEYFSFALHALETNDLMNMLRRNNIIPNGRVYTRAEVENAIITSIGVRPYLLCNLWGWNHITSQWSHQLHQIIMCYDDNARRRQDCPLFQGLIFGSCPSTFNWNV